MTATKRRTLPAWRAASSSNAPVWAYYVNPKADFNGDE
jgi:hypothetical protein